MNNYNCNEKTNDKIIQQSNIDTIERKVDWLKISLAILLIICVITTIIGIFSSKVVMRVAQKQTWEYKTVIVPLSLNVYEVETAGIKYNTTESFKAQLDTLGLEGWELVSSYLETQTTNPNLITKNLQYVVLVFKRSVNVRKYNKNIRI